MAWWFSRSYSYAGPGFDWLGSKSAPVGSGLSLSIRVEPVWVPRVARYRAPYAKPPKPDVFFVDSAVACTARFKALVEEFEPGLQLFAPIELQYHDGSPIEGEYYFFNCQIDVDCVLTDNNSEWFHTNRYGEVSSGLKFIQRLTPLEISLSKPEIEGRHLWTGGPLGWNQLFVSDEFCSAFRKGKFREVEIRRECHEVERPWVAEEHMGHCWKNGEVMSLSAVAARWGGSDADAIAPSYPAQCYSGPPAVQGDARKWGPA